MGEDPRPGVAKGLVQPENQRPGGLGGSQEGGCVERKVKEKESLMRSGLAGRGPKKMG